MKKHAKLAATAALGVFVSLGSPAQAQGIGKSPGKVFPDFELPTIDGEETVRLLNLRGKHVLLIEFASW